MCSKLWKDTAHGKNCLSDKSFNLSWNFSHGDVKEDGINDDNDCNDDGNDDGGGCSSVKWNWNACKTDTLLQLNPYEAFPSIAAVIRK